MSSLPHLADDNLYTYKHGDSELLNGFVAGIAGTGLHDEISGMGAGTKRTVRLSANSGAGSFEESGYRHSEASISEEYRSESMEEEFEMRVSEGNSNYPSQFSLLNLTDENSRSDSDATIDVTNCSTIDATLRTSALEEMIREHEKSQKEEDMRESSPDRSEECSVFSPMSSSSFGEFQLKGKERNTSSDSSADSFGDFDEPPTPAHNYHLSTKEDVRSATDNCFAPDRMVGWVQHSSPKKLLDRNFVWVQARSNVTKPSYVWDKLKLHSYLLGALSVRKPISLNRLKPSSGSRSTTSSRSPVSPPVTPVSPSLDTNGSLTNDTDSEREDDNNSLSEIASWNSSSDTLNLGPAASCCKPCVPSVIQRRLSSHRRVHSSPIPTLKNTSPSPDSRSLSSSPGIAVRGLTKSSSLESPGSFDEGHAGRGLSLMQLEDIQTMRHEMKSRVSELSASLIKEFQYRGDADHSKEVKKAFVSAILSAEEKKSKGQLSTKQKSLLPIMCKDRCPPTEILVLLTQLLHGVVNDTPHTADLLKHYVYMLCKSSCS